MPGRRRGCLAAVPVPRSAARRRGAGRARRVTTPSEAPPPARRIRRGRAASRGRRTAPAPPPAPPSAPAAAGCRADAPAVPPRPPPPPVGEAVPLPRRTREPRQPGQSRQQRLKQRHHPGHRRQRVARQSHQPPAARQLGQQHRMSRPHPHAVHHQPAARLGEGVVDEVHRPGRRSPGGHHDPSRAQPQGVPQQPEVVADPAHAERLGAGAAQPVRQHRAERVPHPPVTGRPGVQQFVAEHQEFDGRPGPHGERVVAGRGGQPEHRRGDPGAGREEAVAAPALLSARPDVPAELDRVGRGRPVVEDRPAVPVRPHGAVLPAQHGRRPGRQLRPGGDADGGSVGQRLRPGAPGEALYGAAVQQPPGPGAGDRPAVHRRGVEGGEVRERLQRLGQDASQRLVEADRLGVRRPARPGAPGRGPGLRPAHRAGLGSPGGRHLGLLGRPAGGLVGLPGQVVDVVGAAAHPPSPVWPSPPRRSAQAAASASILAFARAT